MRDAPTTEFGDRLPVPFTRVFAAPSDAKLFEGLVRPGAMKGLLSLAIAGARRQIVLTRLRKAATAAARTRGDAISGGSPKTISSVSIKIRSASARDKPPFSTKRKIKD